MTVLGLASRCGVLTLVGVATGENAKQTEITPGNRVAAGMQYRFCLAVNFAKRA